MARTAWPTVLTGDSWSASQHNTYGRDNDLAYWVYTTAGDLAYATGANALSRLALGAAYKVFCVNPGATAPAWGQAPFVTATKYDATTHTYNSTTERDMPNSSGTITLLVQSTIIVWARVQASNNPGNCWMTYAVNIDGVNGNFSNFYYGAGVSVDFPAYGRKTGVAAGARTIKFREREGYGAGLTYEVGHLEWMAIAIPE